MGLPRPGKPALEGSARRRMTETEGTSQSIHIQATLANNHRGNASVLSPQMTEKRPKESTNGRVGIRVKRTFWSLLIGSHTVQELPEAPYRGNALALASAWDGLHIVWHMQML